MSTTSPSSAPGGTRTLTGACLRRLPLPVGLRGRHRRRRWVPQCCWYHSVVVGTTVLLIPQCCCWYHSVVGTTAPRPLQVALAGVDGVRSGHPVEKQSVSYTHLRAHETVQEIVNHHKNE